MYNKILFLLFLTLFMHWWETLIDNFIICMVPMRLHMLPLLGIMGILIQL